MESWQVILIITTVIVIAIYSVYKTKKIKAAWTQAAGMLGMACDPGGIGKPWKISGEWEDHVVLIETFIRYNGKHHINYTRYTVTHRRPLRVGFDLRRESFTSGVRKTFGAHEIQTGDHAFDSIVLIKASDPDAVLEFLTAERRAHIQQAMREFDDLEINRQKVTMEIKGVASSSQTLIHAIRSMVRLSGALAEHRP